MMFQHQFQRGFSLKELEIDQFYLDLIGERWNSLKEKLLLPEIKVARWNQFSSNSNPDLIFSDFERNMEVTRDSQGLLQYYIMDYASIFVAQALQVKSGHQVLDMCAAPGGKTLILAEQIGEMGQLIANELSENRRERLVKVIQQYIPRDVRDRIWVTGRDGGKFALSNPQFFDRILIDAPCSGERHLLQDPKAIRDWTPNRSKKLAQRQYALLTAGLLALKSEGQLIYSTCSVSPLENDEVILRLLKKKNNKEGQKIEVIPVPDLSEGFERTEFGVQIWPDKTSFGPMYFSLLKKN